MENENQIPSKTSFSKLYRCDWLLGNAASFALTGGLLHRLGTNKLGHFAYEKNVHAICAANLRVEILSTNLIPARYTSARFAPCLY